MLLKSKKAVIYGAAGAIGGAVARAFAREGAMFLAGRTLETLNKLAWEITNEGGAAEAAQVDALDPLSIEQHLDGIIHKEGSIDISFNAIWIRGDLQGTPLIKMSCEDFTLGGPNGS